MNLRQMLFAAALSSAVTLPATAQLQRMAYNNPKATADLGVGLWAWPLPMDYDGDGDYDLVVSCPDKPYNGTYFFENPGKNNKDPFPTFKPGVRVGKGYTNIQISYVEGKPRVLIPANEITDFRSTSGRRENGFTQQTKIYDTPWVHQWVKERKIRANQWRYVDYDGDGKTDVVVGVEDWEQYGWDNAFDSTGKWVRDPLHGYVYLLRNTGSNDTPNYEKPRKLEAGGKIIDGFGMPSPSFADFDGDGDLDLITGEFLDGFTYYENTGTRTAPQYAAGRRLSVRMDLEMITPVGIDWDRDGDTDLICGDEDGRVAFIEHTGKMENGAPVFKAPRYFRQQAADVKFGALASPFGVDWDGDGDDDIISGNTAGYIGFIENLGKTPDGKVKWAEPVRLEAQGEVIRRIAGPNGSIQGPAEAKWGYTTLSVADWDGDKLPDIIVNDIWGKPHWYRNVGTRTAPKLAKAQPIEVEWATLPGPKPAWTWWVPQGKELATQWRTTPTAIDWNRDGLTDLVMLDHEGYLAFYRREKRGDKLVLLPPQRIFVNEKGDALKLSGGEAGKSGRRKICLTDFDGDGRVDMLINAANAEFWKNISESPDRVVLKNMGLVDARILAGHDTSPTMADIDGDGVKELVVGAEDGFFYTMPNPHAPGRVKQAGIRSVGYIYESGSVPETHASTIVETPAGLVASWFGGIKEGTDDVSIWVSRHVDGKWLSPVSVAKGVEGGKQYPCWNPVLFQPKGDKAPLMLFYKVGPSPSTWWGMLMTSKDNGKTWTKPKRLPDGVLGPIKNQPIQLADGALISPTSTEHDGWRVHFEISRDMGKTWQIVGPIHDAKEAPGGAIQPAIITHKDGTLEALCRAQKAGRILSTKSTDGGQTWSKLIETALPNPNSGIDAVTLRDGRHVLIYNHTAKGRSPLNVAISEDDGRTWKAALTLEAEPGEYSYPFVIEGKDGRVHIAYTWKRQRVKLVSVDAAAMSGVEIKDGVWPK